MDKKTTLRGTLPKVLRTLEKERKKESDFFEEGGWLQSKASFLTPSQREALRDGRYICRQKADKKTIKVYVAKHGAILAKNGTTQSVDALKRKLDSFGYKNVD